jgi:peroxiredoxin (alkyl hydroperoxide reductase subunit C)
VTMSKARVQKPAPAFCGQAAMPDGTFEGRCYFRFVSSICMLTTRIEISLTTYTTLKKWTVLVFIPMAWTFVCPTEIVAFSNATSQFANRGAQVIICSTDSAYSLLAWRNTSQKDGGLGPVDVPLLSDKNQQISRDYGVLIEEEGIALRGMFLIDTQGILRQVCLPFEDTY